MANRPIRIAQPRTRGDDDRAVPIGLLIDGNLIKEPIAQEMIFPPVRISAATHALHRLSIVEPA
jgi:hypothetical protein